MLQRSRRAPAPQPLFCVQRWRSELRRGLHRGQRGRPRRKFGHVRFRRYLGVDECEHRLQHHMERDARLRLQRDRRRQDRHRQPLGIGQRFSLCAGNQRMFDHQTGPWEALSTTRRTRAPAPTPSRAAGLTTTTTTIPSAPPGGPSKPSNNRVTGSRSNASLETSAHPVHTSCKISAS